VPDVWRLISRYWCCKFQARHLKPRDSRSSQQPGCYNPKAPGCGHPQLRGAGVGRNTCILNNLRQAAVDLLHELAAEWLAVRDTPSARLGADGWVCFQCMLLYTSIIRVQCPCRASQTAEDTYLFCQACKQPGMESHNWFCRDNHCNNLEPCIHFLYAPPT